MKEGFGAYLRQLRDERGLSLRAVESYCKVSNGYISLLEHERVKDPSPRVLYQLAECYGVDYLDLMARAGYPLPPSLAVRPQQQHSVVFYGADQLTEDDRREIQDFIHFKLAQTKKRQAR